LAASNSTAPGTVEVEHCAPCTAACPVGTDVRGYVELISQGRYEEAFEKIREFNPFPSVCGLICHHPCEQECRRQEVDEAVGLRNLKRFAAEQALGYRERVRHRADITHAETIGIVGSGPAGLTVAHDCIQQGYAVTVYESLPKAGGMLIAAIPKYRLPEDVVQQDLDDILALGVEIETGVSVGKDVTLAELQKKHSAVVLAVGLSDSRDLPLENRHHPDVLPGVPLLRDVALGKRVEVRDRVLVIGGGDVAIDVARTAMRLGATNVKIVCLENEEEMPAWQWERREALEEGVEILYRRGPTKVIVEDGRVAGLVLRQVERVFDGEGKFSPTYFDDRLSTIEGQMVLIAIGQSSDLALVQGSGVALNERGLLVFDPQTMATSERGVFACGEIVTGPGSAIEAIANGHRAARAALAYLQTGQVRPLAEQEELEPVEELPQDVIENVRRAERRAMPTLSPQERKKSLIQFELGYSEEDALTEARRCLSCTAGATVDESKCAACLTCLRVCPFDVPVVEDVAVMGSDMCQACGLCAAECPAVAVSIKRFAVGDIKNRIVTLLNSHPVPVTRVEIVCTQDATARQDVQDRIVTVDGDIVAKVAVTCAARADEVDMMKPFELGAQAVVVRMCSECRYRGAPDRLTKRVDRTKELLDAAGVGGDRLSLV